MDGRNLHAAGAAGSQGETVIRPRRHGDLELCVRALAEVHARDGYPLHWPDDPVRWLTPEGMLGAWVAVGEDAVIGHVALVSAVGDGAAPVWSAASGLPPERIAVVAKLFVAPAGRGRGLGALLLDQATAEARRRGLHPALEVLDHDRAAMALYERAGWQRVGSAPAPWAMTSAGQVTQLHYFIAPDALSRHSIVE
jgi:GNAT superfamily N-acetyltransferase